MGALCSCFRVADVEELAGTSNSNHGINCMCSNCLMQRFKLKCRTLFPSDTHSVPSAESVSSSSSAPLPNTSEVDVNINVHVTTNIKYENLNSQKDLALKCTNPPQLDLTMQRKVNLHIGSNFVINDGAKVSHSEEDEDEDVCPTCLEEYTCENPKIVIQCKHSYHLSCIYEWMERNETCPICGKLMVFDETTQSSTVLRG